tara:strand:- start:485 stop:1198 length:714 start_codon:yes stop_codon:yes gene_type:complete
MPMIVLTIFPFAKIIYASNAKMTANALMITTCAMALSSVMGPTPAAIRATLVMVMILAWHRPAVFCVLGVTDSVTTPIHATMVFGAMGSKLVNSPPQLTAGRFWGKTPHQTNRSASAKTTHLLATHRWFATKPTILACNASPRTIAPNRFQPVMVSPNVSTTPVGFRVIPVPKRPTPFVSAMAQPILVVYAMNTMTVMTGCHAQQTPVPLGHAKILTTAPPAFATMTWIAVLNASAI